LENTAITVLDRGAAFNVCCGLSNILLVDTGNGNLDLVVDLYVNTRKNI
jgi:hypothetical protein